MTKTSPAQTIQLHRGEGLKDTIESIVVALILAFVFRAFVVEAFVIPTGSMAPTLYGAHGTQLCEDCGTEFAYGLRDLKDATPTRTITRHSRAICPNCRHENTNLKLTDEDRAPESGDRILVLKWPFSLGSLAFEAARWDVTVFKDPADGTTNFIKRLVGLPNEVLLVLDGDVYTVPVEELSADALADLDDIRHMKYRFRTGQIVGQLRVPSAKTMAELDEKLRIPRKSPAAQKALWTMLYNHDYLPKTPSRRQPSWVPPLGEESGWNALRRVVEFKDRHHQPDYISLSGQPVVASCSYNIPPRSSPPVADLRVRFVLTPLTPTGTVRVRLEKLGRVFWASVTMDGEVSLTESNDLLGKDFQLLATARVTCLAEGKSVEVGFENIDYRLAVRVGGEEVLRSSEKMGDQSYYHPDIKALRSTRRLRQVEPPRLYAEGGDFEIKHLVVDRDAYYYNAPGYRSLALSWAPERGWASPQSPMLLRGHEYFMLGDNTTASKDSRLWDVVGQHLLARGEAFQLGTVPKDQLIGKAFFVYWPSPHRLDWLPIPKGFGVVPDVGRMRWIR